MSRRAIFQGLVALGISSATAGCGGVSAETRDFYRFVDGLPASADKTSTIDCAQGFQAVASATANGLNSTVTVKCMDFPGDAMGSTATSERVLNSASGNTACLPGERAHATATVKNNIPSVKTSCTEPTIPYMLREFLQRMPNEGGMHVPAPRPPSHDVPHPFFGSKPPTSI